MADELSKVFDAVASAMNDGQKQLANAAADIAKAINGIVSPQPSPVRAKFKVISITRSEHWDKSKGRETQTIKLQPVTGGSDENKAFYAATPSGFIELSTINESAGRAFELGEEYYVDFTPAKSDMS